MRVLVVDDDEWQLRLLSSQLESIGIRCFLHQSITEHTVKQLQAVDAVFLDLIMPEIDGIDMLKFLADKKVTTPVYFISSAPVLVLESLRDTACKFGLNVRRAIQKPVDLETLKEVKQDIARVMQQTQNSQPTEEQRLKNIISLDMTQALDEWWFSPHYQLQYDVEKGTFCGVECLARMSHPVLGNVSPASFIPELEKAKKINQFTLTFVKDICNNLLHHKTWQKLDYFAINISAMSLTVAFVNRLHNLIRVHISPERCVLEITESVRLTDKFEARLAINKLSLLGYTLSLDDFGTGQSTISQLNELPFNELKIDRQFVHDLGKKKTAEAIVTATIDIAKELDYTVLAEGVETEEQFEILKRYHCNLCQGFYFAKPVPIDELEATMNNFQI